MVKNEEVEYTMPVPYMNPDVLKQLKAGKPVVGARNDTPLNEKICEWGTLKYAFNAMGFVSYIGISNNGAVILQGADDIPLQGEEKGEKTLEILAEMMAKLVRDSSPKQ